MTITRHPTAFTAADHARARDLLAAHGHPAGVTGPRAFHPIYPECRNLPLRFYEAHGPDRDGLGIADCALFWAPDPGVAAYLAACRLAAVETLADVTDTLQSQEPTR